MSRIYISFLGLGTDKEENGVFKYRPTIYELDGNKSDLTEFVQVAEIQVLGAGRFDKIVIVATQKSYDTHFDNLRKQLKEAGAAQLHHIIIEENMSSGGQWAWFERIMEHIDYGAHLTIDLTHGYRSIPIVFSTAVNFLQKARSVTLDAVYYGAYDKNRNLAPIVNMKEFYMINEWAEAVSRLVEDADARKLARVAEMTSGVQAGELNSPDFIGAFEDLTNAIRNVDVNNVAQKAARALGLIKEIEAEASLTAKIMISLLKDKFVPLACTDRLSGKYDKGYFTLQLEIIRLLLEHKLYMQAFTVMREVIGSIGMVGIEKAKTNNAKGRSMRKMYADVFVNMLQYRREKWDFRGEAERAKDKLVPFYEKLVAAGVENRLRGSSEKLAHYRNGFDHAWTSKSGAASDVEEVGAEIYEDLEEVIRLLAENGILR